jgi:hypothetical protein
MSLLLGLVAAAALAPFTKQVPAPQNRQMTAEFASCIVRRKPHKAKLVVLSNLESSAALGGAGELLLPDCLPYGSAGEMTLQTWPILIRAALAQALIAKEHVTTLPQLGTVPPLEHGVAGKHPERGVELGIAMSQLGECVVRHSPSASTQLVRSDVGSGAETAAFETLKPALSSCLSAGDTFSFSPEMVRAAVTLNYYRLAHAGGGVQ